MHLFKTLARIHILGLRGRISAPPGTLASDQLNIQWTDFPECSSREYVASTSVEWNSLVVQSVTEVVGSI